MLSFWVNSFECQRYEVGHTVFRLTEVPPHWVIQFLLVYVPVIFVCDNVAKSQLGLSDVTEAWALSARQLVDNISRVTVYWCIDKPHFLGFVTRVCGCFLTDPAEMAATSTRDVPIVAT